MGQAMKKYHIALSFYAFQSVYYSLKIERGWDETTTHQSSRERSSNSADLHSGVEYSYQAQKIICHLLLIRIIYFLRGGGGRGDKIV